MPPDPSGFKRVASWREGDKEEKWWEGDERNSPCYSPCVASPVGNSLQGGPGLSGLVHEEAHPCIFIISSIACFCSVMLLLLYILSDGL